MVMFHGYVNVYQRVFPCFFPPFLGGPMGSPGLWLWASKEMEKCEREAMGSVMFLAIAAGLGCWRFHGKRWGNHNKTHPKTSKKQQKNGKIFIIRPAQGIFYEGHLSPWCMHHEMQKWGGHTRDVSDLAIRDLIIQLFNSLRLTAAVDISGSATSAMNPKAFGVKRSRPNQSQMMKPN